MSATVQDEHSEERERARRANRALSDALAAVWSLPTHMDFVIRDRLDRLIEKVAETSFAAGHAAGRATVRSGTYDEGDRHDEEGR